MPNPNKRASSPARKQPRAGNYNQYTNDPHSSSSVSERNKRPKKKENEPEMVARMNDGPGYWDHIPEDPKTMRR